MATIKQQKKRLKINISPKKTNVLDGIRKKEEVNPPAIISNWEKITGLIFGVTFFIALLVLSVFISNPSPTQYAIFKTILAMAAAGIGGILGGTIHVKGSIKKWSVRAGGAMALFIVVYFFTPAPANTPEKGSANIQTIEEGATGVIHSGSGDVNIQQ